MTNCKYISLASLAGFSAVAVLAFGFAAPQARAQVGFGISIGSPGYATGYAPRPGYVYQRGYWQPDPDGDGNVRWIPGGWMVAPDYDGYYNNGYYGAGYPEQYQRRYYYGGERARRGYGYSHRDDDEDR